MPASLKILYKDSQLVAVEKPAGMLVHPGRETEPDSEIAMKVVRDQLEQHVYPVHRLDRPTSGILLFVLEEQSVSSLREQFDQKKVRKVYHAVVVGDSRETWESNEPLQKSEDEPFRDSETLFAKKGETAIEGIQFSILEATPATGRFHQIRKHLAADGMPIVGDYLYGDVEMMDHIAEATGQPRLMLHASRLSFIHPKSGETISLRSSLPARFEPFVKDIMLDTDD